MGELVAILSAGLLTQLAEVFWAAPVGERLHCEPAFASILAARTLGL